MRLLHTSDWHVGRTFQGRDLLAEQEAVLGGLADVVADENIDVVVVSGDLYDRAVPSGESVEACVRVLARLRAAGARIVVIPGNHDSAPRGGALPRFPPAGGGASPRSAGGGRRPPAPPSLAGAGAGTACRRARPRRLLRPALPGT